MVIPCRDNHPAVEIGFHEVRWQQGSYIIIIIENQND